MEQIPFTEEQWIKYSQEKELKIVECQNCGNKVIVPAPACKKCGSRDLAWKDTSGAGTIYTYTVTAVAPPELTAIAPYVAGIIDLEEGIKISAIITGVTLGSEPPEDLIGKPVQLDFLELEDRKVLAFRLAE
jgi:hypothetical protein